MSARIAPRLRALLSTLTLCILLRPPKTQGHSGDQSSTGNYADKMQRAFIREAANRMGHGRSSTGDFALGGSERLFSGGQRGPINIIRGHRRSSGKRARHVLLRIWPGDRLSLGISNRNTRALMCHMNLPQFGGDRLLGCPISEGVYLNKGKSRLGLGAIWWQ